MSSPAERLRALSEAAGFESLSEFSRAATIPESSMRQHIARDSVPKGAAALYVRAARHTGADVEWLLYGKGKGPQTVDGPPPPPQKLTLADAGTVSIAELEVHGMAGHGADAQHIIAQDHASESIVGRYSFPAAGFRQAFGANASDVIIAEVMGDSMLPTLYPGQKVMVNTRDTKPTPPGLFYVWDGMGLVIKRVELVPGSNPPTVRIKSDNPKYDTYERTIDEAYINGRIILGFTRF